MEMYFPTGKGLFTNLVILGRVTKYTLVNNRSFVCSLLDLPLDVSNGTYASFWTKNELNIGTPNFLSET